MVFIYIYISCIPHIVFLELRKQNPLILLKKELLYLAKRLMGHDNVRARSHHVCLESAGWTIMCGIDQWWIDRCHVESDNMGIRGGECELGGVRFVRLGSQWSKEPGWGTGWPAFYSFFLTVSTITRPPCAIFSFYHIFLKKISVT
jgi:hypothetical protein